MSPNEVLSAGSEVETQILARIKTHCLIPCRRSGSVRLQMRSNNPAYCDSDLQRLGAQSCLDLQKDKITLNHGILQVLGQRQTGDL